MKAEMIFEAIDKASSVIRGIAGATKKLAALSGKGFALVDAGARKVGKGLLAATAIATGFAASIVALSRKLLGPTREFEKFQAVLETTEGSATKAKAALSWAETFAAKTPYELAEVTDAFVKLRAYGLDPTNGLLKSLGNTASAMDKPIMQAVEAIADAVTGENERLKEFGIKARAQGKYFLYEYTENGVTKVAKALKSDRAAIEKTLRGIFDTKYAGAMERRSKTWDGITSNLLDFWTKFQRLIMDSGPFDYLKSRLKEVLSLVEEAFDSGKAQAIAEGIGKAIVSTFKWIEATVRATIPVVRTVVETLGKVADFVGGWDRLAMIIAAAPFAKVFAGAAVGVMQMAGGFALIAASPVGWVLGAAAAAAYLLVDDWGAAFDWLSAKWDWLKTAASAAWQKVAASAQEAWADTKAFFADLWTAITPKAGWASTLTGAWETVKAAWSGAPEWVKTLITTFSPIGPAISLAFDGVGTTFERFKAVVVPIFNTVKGAVQGFATGFSGYLEPIGDKMRGLVDRLGRMGETFASIFSRIAGAFDGKGGQALSKAAELLGSLAGLSLEALVSTLDLAAAGIETLLNALDEFLGWALDGKSVDWSRILPEMPDFSGIKQAFSDLVSLDWLPDWSWPEITLPNFSGVKGAISGPIEAAFGIVDSVWGKIKALFDWSPIDAIMEKWGVLEEKIGALLGKVAETAGAAWQNLKAVFSDDAEIAISDPAAVERAAAAAGTLRGHVEAIARADTSAVVTAIADAERRADSIVQAVKSAIERSRALLNATSFVAQGRKMMETLAQGIREKAGAVTAAIRNVTQQVRDHLPSSPAKVGPLSDLHRLKFGETIARSIKAEPMVAAMRRAALATLAAATPMAGATMQPAIAGTEAPAPVSLGALGAQAASQAGPGHRAAAQPVSITYAPKVTIEGGSPADAAQFEQLLRDHGDELARIVEKVVARNRRLDF